MKSKSGQHDRLARKVREHRTRSGGGGMAVKPPVLRRSRSNDRWCEKVKTGPEQGYLPGSADLTRGGIGLSTRSMGNAPCGNFWEVLKCFILQTFGEIACPSGHPNRERLTVLRRSIASERLGDRLVSVSGATCESPGMRRSPPGAGRKSQVRIKGSGFPRRDRRRDKFCETRFCEN